MTDGEFWDLFLRHRGTSFAGVPYTFELLERVGFDAMDLPDLRYLTQAGGRMPAERVRRFAELGRRHHWDLFVMYGATEATARMAYLPPELAASRPDTIGRPIPGGWFTIEPVDGFTDDAVGQLIYRGPNVMMGYAHGPADLALGKTVDTLHTGDIAKRGPDGLYEVIGRSSRFAKLYGLRIDLQRVEAKLREHGVTAFCAADDDDRLVVAATGDNDAADVQHAAADAAGVPAGAVLAVIVDELPMLSSGKPDYQRVRTLAQDADPQEPDTINLRALFADVLHLDAATVDPEASFIDLGGNSLSYVMMSVRLERALGKLPSDWQRLPIRELEGSLRPARRRWWESTLETSVALRAAAIVLIVGSHAELFKLWGGAHILLGVAGYNFARFCLTPVPRTRAGAPAAQHDWVDRGAVGDLGRHRTCDHRRLPRHKSAACQQVPRPARQHDGGTVVVRRSVGMDTGGAGRGVLDPGRRSHRAAISVHVRRCPSRGRNGVALRRLAATPGP